MGRRGWRVLMRRLGWFWFWVGGFAGAGCVVVLVRRRRLGVVLVRRAAAGGGSGQAGVAAPVSQASAAGGSGVSAGGGSAGPVGGVAAQAPAGGSGGAGGVAQAWVVVVLGRGVGLCRRRRVVGVGCCLSRLVVGVRVGWWLGWFRRGLVLVVGGLGWGWVSCWRVRGCRCRRGCGRCLRRGVWIRGWCRCWGVRWSIIRLWWGGWSRWLIRCMRSR